MKNFDLVINELEVVEEMDASDTITRIVGVAGAAGLVYFGFCLT